MELTLVYRGRLPSRQQNVGAIKSELRRSFHSQIEAQVTPRLGGNLKQLGTTKVDQASFFSPAHPRLHTAVDLHVMLLTPAHLARPGDIDNRLKTLIDGLTRPQTTQQLAAFDADQGSPIFCLMDDDQLLRRVSLDSRNWHTDDVGQVESLAVITAQIVISQTADGSSPAGTIFLTLP